MAHKIQIVFLVSLTGSAPYLPAAGGFAAIYAANVGPLPGS
jgi:hypothetical protein